MALLKKLKFYFDSLLFHEFSNFCISFISHLKTIFVAVKVSKNNFLEVSLN